MGIADEIERLKELHRTGALNDQEFARAKASILGVDEPTVECSASALNNEEFVNSQVYQPTTSKVQTSNTKVVLLGALFLAVVVALSWIFLQMKVQNAPAPAPAPEFAPAPTPPAEFAPAPASYAQQSYELTYYDIQNATYSYGDQQITLENGQYTSNDPDNLFSVAVGQVVFGDLNNDNKKDAAVILVSSGGGSGIFYSLEILKNQDGRPVHVASKDLGDRVDIKSFSIKSGKIIVKFLTQGPDDPSCCPTVLKTLEFGL